MEIFAVLGVIVMAVVGIGVFSLWNGYVLTVLWRWFMVPVFNLPILSLPVAIGISLVIGLLTQQYQSIPEDDRFKPFVYSILVPFVALAMGWIVHLFM